MSVKILSVHKFDLVDYFFPAEQKTTLNKIRNKKLFTMSRGGWVHASRDLIAENEQLKEENKKLQEENKKLEALEKVITDTQGWGDFVADLPVEQVETLRNAGYPEEDLVREDDSD